MGYIESKKKKTRSRVTAVNDHVRLQPTRKLQDNAGLPIAEVAVFPFGRIKYGLWQVLYLPPSSQNHRLSAGAPDCTAPIDPLLQLSDLTWFWWLHVTCRPWPIAFDDLWCESLNKIWSEPLGVYTCILAMGWQNAFPQNQAALIATQERYRG